MAGQLTRKGKGRPRGSPNKVSAQLKEMVLQALDKAGGVDYLVRQANKKNPAPFMALLGKVLPLTIAGGVNVTNWVVRLPQPAATVDEWREQYQPPRLQ